MKSEISGEFREFVEDQIASGRFGSPEEVVAEALRQMRDRHKQREELHRRMREQEPDAGLRQDT